MSIGKAERPDGGVQAPPDLSPSTRGLRWLIAVRLLVISTLFLGVLIIQAGSQQIFPLGTFYGLFLATYGLSLVYLILFLKKVSTRIQAVIQVIGDVGIVTGFVYATGGLFSPFSFLYLTVIVEASAFLRKWGYLFAGLSAVAYGAIVDLMFFDILPVTPNLVGSTIPSHSRVLSQLIAHVVGFILLAFLVSRLSESHRRLEEEKARASQLLALTDHVVRSVSSGIVATDLEGSVLHLNPTGARILRIADAEQITGVNLEEILPLKNSDWALVRTRARNRSVVRVDEYIEALQLRLGLTVGPLNDETGMVVGFVVNFQDVSEIEQQAEQRRMQERMAAVGEMAARMAHEIKNPLASISGSAQMLSSLGSLDETERRLLGIVVDESQRLSAILDGFLDYTRPSPGSEQPCDIAQLFKDCFRLLERSDEVADCHHLALDVPQRLAVQGNEDQFRQIFWNLSRNAIQAMKNGGELQISAKMSNGLAVLQWKDTGVGMSEAMRQHAFEPFMTSHPGGTGLGLAVVYAVVEDHRGSISIESSPNEGTTVTVELPCLQEVE